MAMSRLRISALLAILAAWTLIDEIIKEGYAFDPNDIVNPQITHEKVFIALLISAILLGLRRNRKA